MTVHDPADEALAAHDAAIAANDRAAHSWLARGVTLYGLGHLEEALASFDAAIVRDPRQAWAHVNRGAVLHELGAPQDALAAYETAIGLDADLVEAYGNRGNALMALRRFDDALLAYDAAIARRADFAPAHFGRGNAHLAMERLEDAQASYEEAIRLDPEQAPAHLNLGVALKGAGRLDEALASYTEAIALKPDYAEAYANRSSVRLLLGDFALGWLDFEWRGKLIQAAASRAYPQPRWTGAEDLKGKTLFVYWEQGLGDTLHFYRYGALLRTLGAHVILAVPPPLVALLRHADPQIEIIGDDDPPAAFDFHIPLMSLGLAFGTDLTTIPADIPYVHADRAKAADWRRRLGQPRRPRVGLVWNGGFRRDQPEVWQQNARRNLSFEMMAGLRDADCDFYSLQKGEPAETDLLTERERYWPEDNFSNLTADLHDFSDTAGLIDNLDLVISVDTSTAHLAGAMGKPLWILLPFAPDWRWRVHRQDSPWYPSARLFRQTSPKDWPGIIQAVRGALALWRPIPPAP